MVALAAVEPRALELRLLGVPCVVRGDGTSHRLEKKDAALLAVLALDGPTPRAKLGALLWPDARPQVSRGNLRQRLFRLRASLADDIVEMGDDVLRLRLGISLDVVELRRQLDGDPGAGVGDLLAGHDYGDGDELAAWVRSARGRWRDTRMNLLAQMASAFELKRQIAAALPYAQRMLADDPVLEHAHRRVMRLHYLRGDRAAAMAAYQRCRDALGAELGLRPSAETVALARLVESGGAVAEAPAPRPVAILRPPRLVGRDAERDRLLRAATAGQTALLTGEAGIGKTRLLAEVAAPFGNDRSFSSGARPGDPRLAYSLLARLVRGLVERSGAPMAEWARRELARVVPELGDPASGPLEPLRLQRAAITLAGDAAAAGLRLLTIDDLQFADDASLELLPALLSALQAASVACLLGARANEVPEALSSWLRSDRPDGDESVEQLALGPLDADGVRALVDSLAIADLDGARWAAPLARHTGGNPLFILETLIAMLDGDAQPFAAAAPQLPAPANVRLMIERRLGQLGDSALRLARLAALAGPDFDVDLAAAVLARHPLDIADDWRELEAALVIRDAAFAHDLVFEATRRSVPVAIARTLHREIAARLQARNAAPARLAAHWEEAEQWQQAGACYERAARTAFAASRRADEAVLWDHAIACHERAGDRAAAFQARCASVEASMAARPLAQAQALTVRLLADAATDAERLDALLARATLLLVGHETAAAAQVAAEAMALAAKLALPWKEFDAARKLAVSLAQRMRGAEGAALLGGFAAQVEQSGDAARRQQYWADMAFVLNDCGRRLEAADAWQRAAESAETLGDCHEVATCRSNQAIMLIQFGRPLQALEQAELARAQHARLGDGDGVAAGAADMNVASFALLLGRFDVALAGFDRALARFRAGAAPTWTASCEHNLASAWLQLGQTARARQAVQCPDTHLRASTLARRRIIEGRLERARGGSALPLLRAALQTLGEDGDPMQRLLAELDEARELDADEAVAQCRRCRDRAERLQIFAVAMKARLLEIEATRSSGDVEAAGALAREVRAGLAECRPNDMYWGEALWLVFRGLDASGDADALPVLGEAARWIRDEALPHVPEPFRDTFLHRQAINQAVLGEAARRLR